MNVPVINHCQKTYRPNPEKLLTRILANIPEKFLVGLNEVRIFDTSPRQRHWKSIACQPISDYHSVIELYMDDSALSGYPFFSVVLFNTMFLGAFTEHIIHDIQPNSTDEDILVYQPGKFDWRWGVYGIWRPLMSLLTTVGSIVRQVSPLQAVWLAMSKHVIRQADISKKSDNDR